jgi:hypothetical protein
MGGFFLSKRHQKGFSTLYIEQKPMNGLHKAIKAPKQRRTWASLSRDSSTLPDPPKKGTQADV